jgi:glycosyltransferase involved in cell wall biosynthesis
MNVLYVYNYYQHPGGEDQAFAAEAGLMEAKGHCVRRYSMHNDAIDGMNRLALAKKLIWNADAYKEIRAIVRGSAIDVVHFHNTFPLISPAAYYAAKSEGARVVHTLHNFRLVCLGALLSRQHGICEDCLGESIPWQGVMHACYRDSTVQSAGVAAMLAGHRLIGTWGRKIDLYIALSEFARDKFIQGGLPAHKIAVKPNFAEPDPGVGSGEGRYALFVGRLSPEKGIDTLLRAWKELDGSVQLKIVGDGPLEPEVRRAAANCAGIEYVGRTPREEVLRLMRGASFLVFPSIWYEGFPMTIVEAYASGLPVLASNLGTMASVVKDGVTGLHFVPGDAHDLANKVRSLVSQKHRAGELRANARLEFIRRYSSGDNYAQLIRIYRRVLGTETVPAKELSCV